MTVSPLRLAVFGATGGTGSHVLRQALAAGHHVTALVRDPARLGVTHERLTVVTGSVLDLDVVTRVVRGTDAVICSLGAPPSSKARLRTVGTRFIVQAMQATGVRRLVVQSSHGIGETRDELPWMMRWFIVPLYLGRVFSDHETQEEVVRASGLDWTLLRPPHLSDDDAATALASGEAYDPERMTMTVARTDVARFLLAEAADAAHAHQTLVVSTAA